MSGSAFLRSNASPLHVWSPVLTTWEASKTVTSFTLAARKVHSDRGIGIAMQSYAPGPGNQDDENLKLAAINFPRMNEDVEPGLIPILTLSNK